MMSGKNISGIAGAGDIAELVGLGHKHFIITLRSGAKFESHRGILEHDDLIGKSWGTQVFSHSNAPFFLLQPSLADLLTDLPRTTQILYPKDIGFILVTMGIGPGKKVIEAGTGSGSMTIALAYAVGDTGTVVSYELQADRQNLARKNLERVGLASRVNLKLGDIKSGMEETDADAFFLDLPNPSDYIPQVRKAVIPGGFICSLLPTVNQVEQLLIALHREHFAFVQVCELMLRYYQAEPNRLRPSDRMVAHTGYLIFGRRIEPNTDPRGTELDHEIGTNTGPEH